ncbi:MAG: methionine gamma-lyase family protein [Clostridia bacterium]|nr:methionine gamma-lyase family protein [Clostridia bacterium]
MEKTNNKAYEMLGISNNVVELCEECEQEMTGRFEEIDNVALFNTAKVLNAFKNNRISDSHFKATTGYGYDDMGRETIEKVYAEIFKTEDALVRINFVNGTHSLSTAIAGNLMPGDLLVSITGAPYDTLAETIGLVENSMSLISMGVKYKQVELKNGTFDTDAILDIVKNNKVKMIFIGRSRGYATRPSQTIEQIGNVIARIKEIDNDVIVMVDNCYGELVETKEPTEVGADIMAGSLIKNLGGGLCETGGYIVGKKELVENAAKRLTAPGIGKECGATLGKNKEILQGLFMAPQAVKNALKTAVLTSAMLEKLGYEVSPSAWEYRTDIIQSIILRDEKKLVSFIQGVQAASPVDSFVVPEPWDMPGYTNPVIMAAGTFVSGASIELSCDAPVKEPYAVFMQGGLTYESAKLGICTAIDKMIRGK